jgi:hypothetical protein
VEKWENFLDAINSNRQMVGIRSLMGHRRLPLRRLSIALLKPRRRTRRGFMLGRCPTHDFVDSITLRCSRRHTIDSQFH